MQTNDFDLQKITSAINIKTKHRKKNMFKRPLDGRCRWDRADWISYTMIGCLWNFNSGFFKLKSFFFKEKVHPQ